MDLGKFSLSLAVKDIAASRAFYEALGFTVIDDHESENWLILRAGEATLGLFAGMFEDNMLTFHPPDVRALQRRLDAAEVPLTMRAAEEGEGPAHAMLTDPDGNNILLDQPDPAYRPNRPEGSS